MMSTDYRGALRTMFATANPDWDDESVRQRVATTVEHPSPGGGAAAHEGMDRR